jgi:hypothetical protein
MMIMDPQLIHAIAPAQLGQVLTGVAMLHATVVVTTAHVLDVVVFGNIVKMRQLLVLTAPAGPLTIYI